ncbi:MAG: hypothetical protein ACREE6_01375 [Limisphaerales bacterium]
MPRSREAFFLPGQTVAAEYPANPQLNSGQIYPRYKQRFGCRDSIDLDVTLYVFGVAFVVDYPRL